MHHALVHFFDTQCLDCVLLALWTINCTFYLRYFNLVHFIWYCRLYTESVADEFLVSCQPLKTFSTVTLRCLATARGLRSFDKASIVALTTL